MHRTAMILIIGLSSCISTWPREPTSDFTILVHEDGGMMNRGTEIVIGPDLSYFETWMQRERTVLFFRSTEAERISLYSLLRQRNFQWITSSEEKVYDRGGWTIELEMQGDRIRRSDSGIHFVDSLWADDWQEILQGLLDFRDAKTSSLTKVELRLGSAEKTNVTSLFIGVNGRSVLNYYHGLQDAQGSRLYFEPGDYRLFVDWTENDRSHRQEIDIRVAPGDAPALILGSEGLSIQ
ncbi:MAG: hypothetical protein KDK37_13950 [Leptospiraceae bacterium]|nr:hypothetical protein [Leptospiraceae bacterium]